MRWLRHRVLGALVRLLERCSSGALERRIDAELRDHADRLARDLDIHIRAHRGDGIARHTDRLAGEEAEVLRRAHGLSDRLGQRLSLLAREDAADLVLPGEDLGANLLKEVCADLRTRASPGRKRGPRRRRGIRDVLD